MSDAATGWRRRPVLVTGHTGFKGGWLTLWLNQLGAQVHGYSLDPPTQPNLFEVARIASLLASEVRADLRDLARLKAAFASAQPEIVFHLAAQPLVRDSYRDPLGTFATNVMGMAHVLEAARATTSVRALVLITTDKVYENRERMDYAYRETDSLGGHDPYSASKAAAEIVAASYRSSFFSGNADNRALVATARAGNVIGGADWASDRLIPDCLRAFERGEPVRLRYPHAVRPWQHVLEPLSGYLRLAERLVGAEGRRFATAWNFGPPPRGDGGRRGRRRGTDDGAALGRGRACRARKGQRTSARSGIPPARQRQSARGIRVATAVVARAGARENRRLAPRLVAAFRHDGVQSRPDPRIRNGQLSQPPAVMSRRFHANDTPLAGLTVLRRSPVGDHRGFLERLYDSAELSAVTGGKSIAQVNRTLTVRRGTVRGMHYQHPPHAEVKLVACLRGQVFDVAVDLRRGSPTFLRWHGETLSENDQKTLVIPEGCAHGFQTLSDNCELLYCHTASYRPDAEGVLNPRDPKLAIRWPEAITELSDRDASHPMLTEDYPGIVL